MCTWIRSCWRRYLQRGILFVFALVSSAWQCSDFGNVSWGWKPTWRFHSLIFNFHNVRSILEQLSLWFLHRFRASGCVFIYLPGAQECASDLGLWWMDLREWGHCCGLLLSGNTQHCDVYKHVNHINKSPQKDFPEVVNTEWPQPRFSSTVASVTGKAASCCGAWVEFDRFPMETEDQIFISSLPAKLMSVRSICAVLRG